MRKPILLWLWLVYSGMIIWQVHAQGRGEDVQPTVEGPTTDSNYNYQYDDTEFESVTTTDETFIPPSTTLKAGRNFGNRIRGINNNSPYNANSVNNNSPPPPPPPSSSSISNRFIDNTAPPFLRPRPTSSSVISYNPANYNRVVKRRKQHHQNRGENSTTTTSTTLINNYNRTTSNYNTLNRTRGQGQEEFTPLSQPTASQNGSNGLHKVMLRKRPRPVTLNDFLTTTSTSPMPTTFDKNIVENNGNGNHLPSPSPSPSPPSFNLPQNNGSSSRPVTRRMKVTSTTSSVSSPMETVVSSTNISSNLVAEPMSHVPVSLPKFEYNPSVSIKDGVYKFRYSEPTYSSKRVYTENFGVSHDSYGYGDDDEVDETTTFTPSPEGSTTSDPYQINIDGSEEEFTSSLPPVYREFFSGSGEDRKEEKREEQMPPPPMDHVQVANVLNAENNQGSVTVTITHTVTANHDHVTPTPFHGSTTIQSNKTRPLRIEAADNQIVGTKLNIDNIVRRPTSSIKDENSHPNTIPIVAHPFNSSSNHSQIEHHDHHLHLRPTPALPTYSQPSTLGGDGLHQNGKNSSILNVTDSTTTHKSNSNETRSIDDNISVGGTTRNNSIVKLPPDSHIENGHHIDNASIQHPPNNESNGEGTVPSPTISSKVLSSIFYTKDENPYYTTSSYSYGATTEYSYYTPHGEYDDGHDHHGDHEHKHGHKDQDNSQKQQELRPTTATYWDSLGLKSSEMMKSKYVVNATDHDTDQDLGYSTPQVDTELPPFSDLAFSDFNTTPMPNSLRPPHDHSNVHDNEIDDGSSDSSDDSSDDDVVEVPKTKAGDKKKMSGQSYENEPEKPSVPVFIQVLLDMPATIFCSSVPRFKEMIVKVYAAQLEITKEQVIVFNEPNCGNLTLRSRNITNNSTNGGNIRYATTTASVIKTVSSTARTVVQRRNITGFTTATTTRTSSKPRTRRNDHHNSYHYHSNQENNDINGTSGSPSDLTKLYPVFFYLTDKNGTYNQNLTESFIEFWTIAKATSSNTMFFDKIRKVEMMNPTQISEQVTTNENSGIIAAITIASIAAVCLFLLGVLLLVMRHRQAATKFAKRCTPVSLDDYSLDNISVYNSFRRKQRNRASKRSYTNAAFDDPNAPSRPCNATALAAIVRETQKLEEEFQDLPNMSPTMDDIPVGAETKNRYANVIPIPDTRVLLTFQEDVPNSDYINANFVRGPMGTSKGYIITQGPLDDTVVDFWRLVWEQQIRVIMMLTDFSEAGIPKCVEYYPRSETVDCSQLHGDYQITLEKRDIAENCITSYLVIKDMERNLRRDVIHLWYHSWPEKGIPTNPKLTLDFLIKSRKFTKEPTPVLVHCSPGTGRSGTLVACDICIREFETQQNVNIPRTVMKIRQDRAGAVQTKEQYLHIYDVVHYYASRLGSQLDSI